MSVLGPSPPIFKKVGSRLQTQGQRCGFAADDVDSIDFVLVRIFIEGDCKVLAAAGTGKSQIQDLRLIQGKLIEIGVVCAEEAAGDGLIDDPIRSLGGSIVGFLLHLIGACGQLNGKRTRCIDHVDRCHPEGVAPRTINGLQGDGNLTKAIDLINHCLASVDDGYMVFRLIAGGGEGRFDGLLLAEAEAEIGAVGEGIDNALLCFSKRDRDNGLYRQCAQVLVSDDVVVHVIDIPGGRELDPHAGRPARAASSAVSGRIGIPAFRPAARRKRVT